MTETPEQTVKLPMGMQAAQYVMVTAVISAVILVYNFVDGLESKFVTQKQFDLMIGELTREVQAVGATLAKDRLPGAYPLERGVSLETRVSVIEFALKGKVPEVMAPITER